jgi:hypothetical protein
MLLVGTRVALGVGIGLLAARRLDDRTRRGAGAALLAVGALTTLPIVLNVRASSRRFGSSVGMEGSRGPRNDQRGARATRDVPMPP